MRGRFGQRFSVAVVLAAALGVAGACFSERPDDDGDMPMEPRSGLVEIQLTDALRFVPAEVTITPGTTVRWVTVSSFFHTITPRDGNQAGVWTREPVPADDQPFEHSFTVAGQVYDYFCEPHESAGMLGKITVVQR